MSSSNEVRRVPNICYEAFRSDHLVPNQPLIVGPLLVEEWPCRTLWRVSSLDHRDRPETSSLRGLEYLRKEYGEMSVPVDEDGCRTRRPLQEVLDVWEERFSELKPDIPMYVKDWHLALELENGNNSSYKKAPFYKTPSIFADDWMNRYYLEKTKDDFRFVVTSSLLRSSVSLLDLQYMGPKGTFTRLHRDVYTSYSWSTNVVGRKRWWLFPPEVTPYITKPNGTTIADGDGLLEADFKFDVSQWPKWDLARQHMYIVDQDEGETIFVPSGWYHQVLNMTFCISINHNWSNSHNLLSMYHSMVEATKRVEESIDDVKELLQKRRPADEWEDEWRTIVQDLLKRDAGWDWETFLGMILINLEDLSQELGRPSDARNLGHNRTIPEEPSYSSSSNRTTPDTGYVLSQVSACMTAFASSPWGQHRAYANLISRISALLT